MYILTRKQYFITLLLFGLIFSPSCMLFKKKDPTSVEQAEKLISKDRQRRKNATFKTQKQARKAHWNRQSKAARKTIKKAEKNRRDLEKAMKRNYKERKRKYG
ncbi:MAG: hypothetical protein HYU67_13005 [Flavobacteriia bacterium]|nr:hypothetical protein [Flavobacteriia bacterium]